MDNEIKTKLKESIRETLGELGLDESVIDFSLEIPDAFLSGNTTLGELLNIPNDIQESLYSIGYDLFSNKKYDKASKIFDFLCMVSPTERKHWIGAAGCKKLLEDYNTAVFYYTNMTMMWPAQLLTYLDLSECMIKLEMLDEAKACLEGVLSICKVPEVLELNKAVNSKEVEAKIHVLLTIVSNLEKKREDKDN